MLIFSMLCAAVFGLAIGSFFNLCIDRIPRGGSIVSPPSHCDGCGKRLKVLDLIPVFSYLWLKGRCRYCGSHIPIRVLNVELTTAALFTFLTWYFEPGLQLVIALVYVSILLVIFVIDLEHLIIPNKIIYPAMIIALVFSGFWAGFEGFWPEIGLLNALLGGAIGMMLLLVPFLFFPDGLGMGDVKLALFMGLACGFPLIFVALMVGILYGGLVAIFLLLFRKKGRKDAIPFGPFLAGGMILTLLWGGGMLEVYENAMFNLTSML